MKKTAVGCLKVLGGMLLWLLLALVGLVSLVAYIAGEARSTELIATGVVAAVGIATIVLGRSKHMAMGLAILDVEGSLLDANWDEAYETDYRARAGVHPGPAIAGVLVLIVAAIMLLSVLFP